MTIARTVEAAENQQFTLPATSDGWVTFAHLIDGCQIAEELGLDFRTLRADKLAHYQQHGEWELTVLEARILLFLEARADRHSGGIGEPTQLVHDLMTFIAHKTGQSYDSTA